MNEQDLKTFFERDRFAAHVGVELVEAAAGKATARLVIGPHHRNAVGVVHGAAIFSLADLVFAVASNSHGQVALGINVSVSFMKAVKAGALVAAAAEDARNPRLATYTIRVSEEESGELVALMQGTVYRKKDRLEDLLGGPPSAG